MLNPFQKRVPFKPPVSSGNLRPYTRAILVNPRLLLLDEATLATAVSEEVLQYATRHGLYA